MSNIGHVTMQPSHANGMREAGLVLPSQPATKRELWQMA